MEQTSVQGVDPTGDISAKDYLTHCLEHAKSIYLPCTFQGVRIPIPKVIAMKGKVPMKELDVSDMEEMVARLQAEGLNPRVAWQYMGVLRKAIKTAMQEGVLSADPFQTDSICGRINQVTEDEVEKARKSREERLANRTEEIRAKKKEWEELKEVLSTEDLDLTAPITKDSTLKEFMLWWLTGGQSEKCTGKTIRNRRVMV